MLPRCHVDVCDPWPTPNAPKPDELLARLLAEGGYTVGPCTGKHAIAGFAVSVRDSERTFHAPAMSVPRWLAAIAQNLADAREARAYAGAWARGDSVTFDVSLVTPERTQALRLAERHGQLAIFHLAARETIYLDRELVAASLGRE